MWDVKSVLFGRRTSDGIIVLERNAQGFPVRVDVSHLRIELPNYPAIVGCSGKYLPSCCFMSSSGGNAYALACTSFILPDDVTAIGQNAFYNCQKLVYNEDELHFAQLKEIGTSAFQYCNSFAAQNLTLPVVEKIGNNVFSGLAANDTNVVTGNVTLGSVGHAVSLVGTDAFRYQSGITSITVYTQNGLASDLTGAPWGAENATINYVTA